MLHMDGVKKAFGGISVLRGITLQAPRQVITGIIGPNGAGKSTLLNVAGGLFKCDSGAIKLGDEDIGHLAPYVRARMGLVRTFQISRELGELTVLENLLLARANQTGESVLNAFYRASVVRKEERAAARKARQLLVRVGLWRLADEPAKGLSGGQKKLLELCRALMLDPKIILLDEPAAGVSPPMRAEISSVIRELRSEGFTFVIVEHDMDMVESLCDQVYVIAEGANLVSGTFREVVSDQRVVHAYLGGVSG